MTSLSSHEHTHHGCKQNSTHTKFYKIVLHTHTPQMERLLLSIGGRKE